MKLWWHTQPSNVGGNRFGYAKANLELCHAVQAAGVTIDPMADVAVHLAYPPHFEPLPGRTNVLFTMSESTHIPEWMWRRFGDADLLLVPSAWGAACFRRYTETPIAVVPLGIDPADFPRVARARPPGRPFRWLFCAADNLRKGVVELHAAWKHGVDPLATDPRVQLYLKTSYPDDDPRPRGVEMRGNVVVDTRTVDQATLLAIYAEADGFVIPTQGEGFGLTALEAMATGLPVVTILETGLTEFATRETVYNVRHHACIRAMHERGEGWFLEPQWQADVPDLARLLRAVAAHPREARQLGARAAKRAHRFTWASAAQQLLRVLTAHGRQEEEEDHGHLQCA